MRGAAALLLPRRVLQARLRLANCSHPSLLSPTDVQAGSGMGPRSRLPSSCSHARLGSAVLSPQAGGSSPVNWL